MVAVTHLPDRVVRRRFLARSRLLAALSGAVVVAEAGYRSGSLHTAARATELGRPVGAVPGPVTSAASAGCHRLMRDGLAEVVTGYDDIRSLLDTAHNAARQATGRTAGLEDHAAGRSTAVSRPSARGLSM